MEPTSEQMVHDFEVRLIREGFNPIQVIQRHEEMSALYGNRPLGQAHAARAKELESNTITALAQLRAR